MRRLLTTALRAGRRYSSVTAAPPAVTVRVGDLVHGYEVLRVQPVLEKALQCVELRHVATGAHHLHVAAHDSNNVFGVTFVTVPQDSTGVAHILEHTALCGSARFPVRDPFFNMIK